MLSYAITDPSTLNFNKLQQDLNRFSKKASMIVYRDKYRADYAQYAQNFMDTAKDFEKVLLHSDYLLAKQLKADGVHLKSTQFSDIASAKALGLFVIVSTHSMEEALAAEVSGADMITVSPVFPTPDKGVAMGIEAFKTIVLQVQIPVIALGGILTENQISRCKDAGAKGFGSIRYFAETTPEKSP